MQQEERRRGGIHHRWYAGGRQGQNLRPVWLDKDKLNATLARIGFYYERYPHYHADDGLTSLEASHVKAMVATIASALEFVAYHPTMVDDHQDVFVYRKR